ncbi:MAG: MBL fold metallo-hydrolase, partial [Gemmatimonadetes bacterium]|nr:MBL fold metallo-hydrolase [Gemmatimonadota bacterium]
MPSELRRSVSRGEGAVEQVVTGVTRVPILFVNAYMVGDPDGPWVLVDTGLSHTARWVRAAVQARYGAGARPEAIILTHGHFDHAGAALELATDWDVPIYAHPLELPYLTGRSDYPPQDPTLGGAIAMMSRFFPSSGYDFGERVLLLPEDGAVPGLSEWRWIHTPGHAPGHVSLFRDADRTLIAGDAVATMDMDSWTSQVTRKQEFARPPAPFTPDWEAARRSVRMLAALEPSAVAAGHGVPIVGARAGELLGLAERFPAPQKGRYALHAARTNEEGVVGLPLPAPDRLTFRLAGAALFTAAAAVAFRRWKK